MPITELRNAMGLGMHPQRSGTHHRLTKTAGDCFCTTSAVNRPITSSSHNSRRQFALVEQRSDAFSGVYPLDGGSKERRDGELGNIAEPLFRWEMHSVRDHDRFDLRCAQ